jgi:hypothetical protein
MSDTPGDERERGGSGEFSDPTAPSYDNGSPEGTAPEPGSEPDTPAASGGEGAREVTWSGGDATQEVPSGETQQLPSTPPAAPGPVSQPPGGPSSGPAASAQGPYGQPPQQPSPYGQTPSPYSQPPQQPSPYGQPQSPYAGGQQPARPAPGAGPGYPYGQQPAYGQQGYGQPQPYGYGQSPYAPARKTNGSAIALLIVSGVSTLFGCLFAIPAVILAILALVKQDDSPSDSARLARWGWIAYAIAVALVVVGGIIAIAVIASTSSVSGY